MGPGLEQVLTDHLLENVYVQGRHLDSGKHPFLAFSEEGACCWGHVYVLFELPCVHLVTGANGPCPASRRALKLT